MGVILAIAFDLASSDGGVASAASSASLLLAALSSLGLWLWGRRLGRSADGTGGGDEHNHPAPGFAEGVAARLAWRLRLWPAPASPAPAVVLPRTAAGVLPPARSRARLSWPDPAASSSPLRAPPGPDRPGPSQPAMRPQFTPTRVSTGDGATAP